MLIPKLFPTLQSYSRQQFVADLAACGIGQIKEFLGLRVAVGA